MPGQTQAFSLHAPAKGRDAFVYMVWKEGRIEDLNFFEAM